MFDHIKKLMLGNSLAQLLQFGSIFILARIYQPSDFGLLAQVQSLSMIGCIVTTLQLHLTIPLSKTKIEANEKLQNLKLLCLLVLILFMIPAVWIGGIITYIVLCSVFLALVNTLTSFLIYQGDFKKMARFYIIRALLIISLQIILASLSVHDGLVIATICGELLSAVYLLFVVSKNTTRTTTNLLAVKNFIIQNKDFSIYGTLQELVSVSAFFAPLLIFNEKYGVEIGGQYAMANRLVWAPIVLISSSLSNVLMHSFGKTFQRHNMDVDLLMKRNIIVFTLFMCCLCFALQPVIFSVLGNDWMLASKIVPLQVVWGAFFLYSTPFRVACRVLKLQRYQLIADASGLTFVTTLILNTQVSPYQAMCMISAIFMLQHCTFSIIIRKICKKKLLL